MPEVATVVVVGDWGVTAGILDRRERGCPATAPGGTGCVPESISISFQV